MTSEVLLRKLTYLRQLLHDSINPAWEDFSQFVKLIEARLNA
jgi:hypothetical protein